MKKITLLFLTFCSFTLLGQVKLTSSVEEYFNGTSWQNSGRYVYSYNGDNNLISEEYFYWNSITSVWELSGKQSIVYSSANKVMSDTYEGYNTTTGAVTYGYKTNYTYNGNNQIIESIHLELKDGVYVNEDKTTFSYSDNKITELIDKSWNGSDWVYAFESDQNDASSKTTVSYGSNGLVSELIYNEWNGSSWSVDGKEVYSYTANNKIASYIYYDWNGAAYDTNYKEEYGYDANGNLLLEEGSDYNDDFFEVNYEVSYTYDTTQMMRDFTHPFKDILGFEALTGRDNSYVNRLIGSSSDENYKTTYNYGEKTASVKEVRFIDFEVYPNPTSSAIEIVEINFNLKQIEIFNILGKKVLTSTKNEVNITDLVNGVYLLKIESEKGEIATKRIVKN